MKLKTLSYSESKETADARGTVASIKTIDKNGKRLPEYMAWKGMRYRCRNKNHKFYKDYGGRGIKVCERWDSSFKNFIKDMGLKPSPEYTLDRIDNDGNYCPENCRWTTQSEQCKNRRSNRWIEHEGVRMTKADWARHLGVDHRNMLVNKKKTFAEIVEHYKNGGGQPCKKIEYNGQINSVLGWSKLFKITQRYLYDLINKYPFAEIYKKYNKNET